MIVLFNSFFQDASRAFRRQLEDKRAVIENNLLTGRQHLGANNEPPTSLSSDTSESDGKLRPLLISRVLAGLGMSSIPTMQENCKNLEPIWERARTYLISDLPLYSNRLQFQNDITVSVKLKIV